MSYRAVYINFKDVPQAELPLLADKVVESMVANVDIFKLPPVALTEVTKEKAALSTILSKTTYQGKTGDIKNARNALEKSLKLNAIYVNEVANGDLAILEKSGYPITKQREPVSPSIAPDWLKVTVLMTGGFQLKAALVKGYMVYLFAYTSVDNPDNDPGNWITRVSTIPEIELKTGFKRGTEYKFAACAFSTNGDLNWVYGDYAFAH